MRELVLNDACLPGGALSVPEAAGMVADVERGLLRLISRRHALQSMRLSASTDQVMVAPGVTLAAALMHLLASTDDAGRLMTRLATKYPVENDVEHGEFEALVEWTIPAHPGSLPLVLCARSGRIAVTISDDAAWTVDPLHLAVAKDPDASATTTAVEVDNVFSDASAEALAMRLTAALAAVATPAELWRDRAVLFPNLDFGPGVEGDLADLQATEYDSAVSRLGEIERAVGAWRPGDGYPAYASSVTYESKRTMREYGYRRVFRSSDGSDRTFERHARLANGYRLHLREVPAARRVEIGYIGPHLPIVT